MAAAAAKFDELANKLVRPDLISDVSQIRSIIERGVFQLVVMGEIKKERSSFINALLGTGNLLPTDIDIATSTVYKITYGPARNLSTR